MFTDLHINVETGEGSPGDGQIIQAAQGVRFDPNLMRPWVGKNGKTYVTVNRGYKYDKDGKPQKQLQAVLASEMIANGVPVNNASLALRKDEWLQMDNIVLRAARQRLRAWSDLAASNTYGGFNAMGKTILEHETMSDPGEAFVDMDGLSTSRTDEPLFKLIGLPLPVTHSNFWFSSRKLAVSRNGNTPLDTVMGEAAGRRVAEAIEKTTIGVQSGISYGTGTDYDITGSAAPTVYGYTNHPDRVTKTDLTAAASTNGETLLGEIATDSDSMISGLEDDNFYGPYMVYVSKSYDRVLREDFKANSDKTVKQRLMEVDQIRDIRRLDYLTGDVIIVVQMTPDVARAINGMDITTIQWESNGGMRLNFKVMAIQVPQIRSDYNNQCGVCHGTTS